MEIFRLPTAIRSRQPTQRFRQRSLATDDQLCIIELGHRANEEIEALVVHVATEREDQAAAVPPPDARGCTGIFGERVSRRA